MKKILFSMMLATAALTVQAQDYGKVQLFIAQKKWDDAIKEVDRLATDKKGSTNLETIAWKATVYSEIANDPTLLSKYPDALSKSYAAIAELRQKDPSNKIIKEGALRAVSIVYANNFNDGRKLFEEKKWDEALTKFTIAEDLGDFISKNGFSPNKQNIDTFAVLFAGYAAQNAQKPDIACKYYEKFADEKIAGKEFEDLYRYMIEHYSKATDKAKFEKYLAVAKELYPKQKAMWEEYEMDAKIKGASPTEVAAIYKAEAAKGTLTPEQHAFYGGTLAEFDKEALSKLDSLGRIDIKRTSSDAFKKAFEGSNNGLYAYNAAILMYQIFGEMDERFYALRGADKNLVAKRAELEKTMQVVANETIEWFEKAYTILKDKSDRTRTETSCLSKSIDDLTNLFDWKRNRARGKDLKAYDAAEAKFKFYDGEHGKYK